MTPDQQEAASIKYVCGLRLARLSSGAWAVWWNETVEILPALDTARLAEFAARELAERELWWSGQAARRQRLLAEDSGARAPVQVASKDAGEMGL